MEPSKPPPDGSLQAPSVTTVLCPVHNLRYSPQLGNGCVLCKRAATPAEAPEPYRMLSVPTPLVVLMLAGAVGAASFFAMRPTPSAEKLVPSAAMLWGSKTEYARCGAQCGQAHQSCDGLCVGRATDSASCYQFCFDEVEKCFAECNTRYQKIDHTWSYYYGSETMPEWSVVLASSKDLGQRLMNCSDEPVRALAYVRVSELPNQANEVRVSRTGLSDNVIGCANAALRETPFAPSPLGAYGFMARFDARHDRVRLVIEQAQAELEAAPRRKPEVIEEPIKSLLFDAKVTVTKQSDSELKKEQALLTTQRERLEALKNELAVYRRSSGHSMARPSSSPALGQPSAREKQDALTRQAAEAKVAVEAAKRNRDELEAARSRNREYREREERVRDRRAWETYMEQTQRNRTQSR